MSHLPRFAEFLGRGGINHPYTPHSQVKWLSPDRLGYLLTPASPTALPITARSAAAGGS